MGELRAVRSVLKLAVEQAPTHTKHISVLAHDPWHVEPLPALSPKPAMAIGGASNA